MATRVKKPENTTMDELIFSSAEQKLMRLLLTESTTVFPLRQLANRLKGVRGVGGPEGLKQILLKLSAVGLMVASGMIGSGLIYFFSGIVIDHFSWQGGFWFKVVLSCIAYVLIIAWVPDSRPLPGPRVDMGRGLLFAPGLVAILLAVQKLGAWGVGDWRVWTDRKSTRLNSSHT